MVTTLLCGLLFDMAFTGAGSSDAFPLADVLRNPWTISRGLPFSVALLLILLAHEMGHYLTCRHYRIDATLPHVIPAPPLLPIPPPFAWLLGAASPLAWTFLPFNPFGTFGAVIRIRSMFYNRRQLFDVGVAGPLAGFVFIVPALALGISLSKDFVMSDPDGLAIEFGEPLLFKWMADVLYSGGSEATISLHPIGMAAWFGLLATSLNLLPIGQLDGGHIVFALFGQKVHRVVSYVTFCSLVALSLFSWPSMGYLVFAVILLVMGLRHPRPFSEFEPPGKRRKWIAFITLIVFLLTFIPVPVRLVEPNPTVEVRNVQPPIYDISTLGKPAVSADRTSE